MEHALGLRVDVVRKSRCWAWWPTDQAPPTMPRASQMLPSRWVVERTFAWLGRRRCLGKAYEAMPSTEEAWIRLIVSDLMLARLATCPHLRHP